jgi:hypothetical protein
MGRVAADDFFPVIIVVIFGDYSRRRSSESMSVPVTLRSTDSFPVLSTSWQACAPQTSQSEAAEAGYANTPRIIDQRN